MLTVWSEAPGAEFPFVTLARRLWQNAASQN